jgi:hypothetical protein
VASGTPRPDGDETSAVAWMTREDLERGPVSSFTGSLLRAVGWAI